MDDPKKRAEIVYEVTADWLAKNGVISTPGHLNVDRTLSDYGLDGIQFFNLSKHISDALSRKAGVHVELPSALTEQMRSGTVGNLISTFTALPGQPTTGLGGPIKPKARSF